MSAVLDVRGARVVIAGRPVLHALDLSVPAGQFVALMGANGSGKSTLVRAVTGLRPLTTGEVLLFGTPLARFREWHRIGFVPQRAGAASGVPASVREVVASGRLGRRRLLAPQSRADRRAVAEALDVVGLAGRAAESVATLSGGQQQRVLIARALAGEPEAFFLDEPTAGVDLHHQEALAESLAVLKERGATIVLVAHELGPLAPLVDRAVVLAHGRVDHDGDPPDGPAHEHHHHEHHEHHGDGLGRGVRHDHTPHVGSPIDSLQEHP